MVIYPLSAWEAEQTINPRVIRGYYVYEWLDAGKVFYVGKGKGRRAWKPHSDEAQQIRLDSNNFKVRIVVDCLSSTMAHFRERRHIKFHKAINSPLVNVRIPR